MVKRSGAKGDALHAAAFATFSFNRKPKACATMIPYRARTPSACG